MFVYTCVRWMIDKDCHGLELNEEQKNDLVQTLRMHYGFLFLIHLFQIDFVIDFIYSYLCTICNWNWNENAHANECEWL